MAQLYQIEQTLLQAHSDVSHYRYDIVNTLTRGHVLSAFSTRCMPPNKLIQRCTKLNEVWTLTKQPVPFHSSEQYSSQNI